MCTARDVRRMSIRTIAIVILNSRNGGRREKMCGNISHCGGVGSKGKQQWQQMELQNGLEKLHIA